jgi:trans-aconitate methyltransferase
VRTEAGPERWDFDALRQRRTPLAVDGAPLLGFADIRDQFESRLAADEGTSLLALIGSAGAGKTSLLAALSDATDAYVVSARKIIDGLGVILDPAGSDVRGLVNVIAQRAAEGSGLLVITYDDVDSDLLPEGAQRFLRELVHNVDVRLIVVTAGTALETGQLPVPATVVQLDQRHATEEQFASYLDSSMQSLGVSTEVLEPDVRDALYSLQEQAIDFRSFVYVVEMLAVIHRVLRAPISVRTLYRVLAGDPHLQQFRSFPGVSVTGDRRLSFRRKDKTELLCDVLVRIYESPREFAAVAAQDLPAFDRTEFITDAQTSYRDALMSMCLTRSPVEIIETLLGPRDLLREVEALELDRSRLFDAPDARKQLLIRGLGFTFVERPKGLSDYGDVIAATREAIFSGGQRQEVVKGSGLTLIQNVESLLLDLLQFWAHYLFGSVNAAASVFNGQHNGQDIRIQRLTVGDVVALLRFIDQGPVSPDRAFSLTLVGRRRPLTDELLRLANAFVERRNQFVHMASADTSRAATVSADAVELLSLAQELVAEAAEAYPAVIKISEIVFDEYSRTIFTGVDSTGATVRFAMTDTDQQESILVASHYYMLPAKRVAVNPVLVPTTGFSSRVLFESAENYDRSSATQRSQGQRLLDSIALRGGERILDAGCGSGKLTFELANAAEGLQVYAVDISPEMIRLAAEHAEGAGVHNVSFEAVDILGIDVATKYDVVFSNATMHWVLPPEKGYQRLFDALVPGGRLAVHQGGQGSYGGLWQHAIDLIAGRGLTRYFSNWTYPAYYPSATDLETLLRNIGFVDISVESYESDGSEFGGLVRDFSNAGLLPFLSRLPETERDDFKREFVRTAERDGVDTYTHRLFVSARHP